MVVGTKIIPSNKLRQACGSVQELRAFSLKLVPRLLQHITSIVDNQRYLVAIELRKLEGIPYKRKKALTEGLLEGVSVKGTINTLVDFEDILSEVSIDKLLNAIFEREVRAYKGVL